MDGIGAILFFLPICLVTAFVCSALREESPRRILTGTARLLLMLVLGIAGFCGLIQGISLAFR